MTDFDGNRHRKELINFFLIKNLSRDADPFFSLSVIWSSWREDLNEQKIALLTIVFWTRNSEILCFLFLGGHLFVDLHLETNLQSIKLKAKIDWNQSICQCMLKLLPFQIWNAKSINFYGNHFQKPIDRTNKTYCISDLSNFSFQIFSDLQINEI